MAKIIIMYETAKLAHSIAINLQEYTIERMRLVNFVKAYNEGTIINLKYNQPEFNYSIVK